MYHLYILAKTKALISCSVTMQLICVYVFALANNCFSHALAHLLQISKLEIKQGFSCIIICYFPETLLFNTCMHGLLKDLANISAMKIHVGLVSYNIFKLYKSLPF